MTKSTSLLVATLLVLAAACDDPDPAGATDGGTNSMTGDGGGMTDAGGVTDAGVPVDAGGEGGEDGGGGETGTITFACPGGTIMPGDNTLDVDGVARTFIADFPTDPAVPMGVVFSWHGFGDTAANYRTALDLDPDAVPGVPLVIITPEDTGLQPLGTPQGLDWDIRAGDSIEFAFFEAMLGCLNEQYEIDPARIYSVGFSAGSVMTALLHSGYPDLISAVAALSGAWFNDSAQADLVNGINVEWDWPALDPADRGAVLLTQGGPSDVITVLILTIFDLEASAEAALPFLADNNRLVAYCPHNSGHTLHPEISRERMLQFLAAHRAGEPSPYLTEDLEGFPASCEIRVP